MAGAATGSAEYKRKSIKQWTAARVLLFDTPTSICQTMKRKSQSVEALSEQSSANQNPEYTVPVDGTMPQLDELDCLLDSCFEAYLDIAPLESPNRLRGLLPAVSESKQRFLLTELVKLDLANSLAQFAEQTEDESPATTLRSIEDYVDEFPDLLDRSRVPFDLVLEEIQLRRENELEVSKQDYARRFPNHQSMIEEWFGYQSSTVVAESSRKSPRAAVTSHRHLHNSIIRTSSATTLNAS